MRTLERGHFRLKSFLKRDIMTVWKNQEKRNQKSVESLYRNFQGLRGVRRSFRQKNRLSRMYYLFRAEVYCAQNFTYKDGDFCALCSIKTPSDKEIELKSAFKNPFFTIAFFLNVGFKQVKIAKEYVDMADEVAKKYYNPKTDCYVKNIGVRKEFRGQGKLKGMLKEFCGDLPIYLETQDENDVAIYKNSASRFAKSSNGRA